MLVANLALRFLLEMGALVALAVWGAHTGSVPAVRVVLGLGVPLLVAVVWGAFVAPAAPRRLPDPGRLVLEVGVFGAAALAVGARGLPLLGASFGVVAVVNAVLVRVGERQQVGPGQ